MKYKISMRQPRLCIFRYAPYKIGEEQYYGPRYMYGEFSGKRMHVYEEDVQGLYRDSVFISNRAMFKLATLNNFLDKLKEMCSTDLNQKQ